jgi:sulfoxide reductase catalytic subunit YedY
VRYPEWLRLRVDFGAGLGDLCPLAKAFGPSLFGPTYYETQTLDNALKPECLLALEMNGEPLPAIHGAPLRLRVENQLGYKMVKWIERIEFVESEKQLGKGEGG